LEIFSNTLSFGLNPLFSTFNGNLNSGDKNRTIRKDRPRNDKNNSFSEKKSFFKFFSGISASPTILYPANNAVNVELTPLLDWTDVTGGDEHRINR